MTDLDDLEDLSDEEIAALHELTLAVEWFRRGHGHLLAFHHAVGRGMNFMADAEEFFRAAGHGDVADDIRDDHLPRGVIDGDRWSYDVVESFDESFMSPIDRFEAAVREEIAGGVQHIQERRLERRYKERRGGDEG